MSRWISIGILAAASAGAWLYVRSTTAPPVKETAINKSEAGAARELILPPAKLLQAQLKTEPVQLRKIERNLTIPGRIGYDEARHIVIKAPVSGILTEIYVKPGDQVAKGRVLARISSPEIGAARADELKARAAADLVQQRVDRFRLIATNLTTLFQRIDKNVSLEQIEGEFDVKSLGSYRETILTAYAQRFYAEQLYRSSATLADSGGIAVRTVRERENNRHIADLHFRTVRESVAFETQLEQKRLIGELADARRRQAIASDRLTTLLGYREHGKPRSVQSLSEMDICAPFSGSIESRSVARSERVTRTDSILVLAKTESLYVLADVRENEWSALGISKDAKLKVTAPAIPGQSFEAILHYVGREVTSASNSIPLVAKIDNSKRLLRPGMFVRVSVPISQTDDVPVVRQLSLLRHGRMKFVFVSTKENTFRRVDVETGDSNPEWVEIKNGLQPGDIVVAEGAFLLKSELLLAGEQL